MLKRLLESGAVRRGVRARQAVTDGPADLSSKWFEQHGRVAVVEESGRLLEVDQCARLSVAFASEGVRELTAVSNDPLLDQDLIYSLDASDADLLAFVDEFNGINAILVPADNTTIVVLCTVDDFHIVAGSRNFVEGYAGDLVALRKEFANFVQGHFEQMQPVLRRASRYMDWISE